MVERPAAKQPNEGSPDLVAYKVSLFYSREMDNGACFYSPPDHTITLCLAIDLPDLIEVAHEAIASVERAAPALVSSKLPAKTDVFIELEGVPRARDRLFEGKDADDMRFYISDIPASIALMAQRRGWDDSEVFKIRSKFSTVWESDDWRKVLEPTWEQDCVEVIRRDRALWIAANFK